LRPITRKSLQELDGEVWGDPPDKATGLMRTVHRLRTVPIGDLAAGELRVLITQGEGLQWLLPIALPVLIAEPLVAGSYYAGDLLKCVMRATLDGDFWRRSPDLAQTLLEKLDALPGDLVAEAFAVEVVTEAQEQLRAAI
jgi:hypothetical protein